MADAGPERQESVRPLNEGPTVRRDGPVALLFFELVVLLVAGVAGWYHVFAFVLIFTIGTFAAIGFARRDDRMSWGPPLAATIVLAIGMLGVFAYEDVVVRGVEDTAFGFHPATAFLVYLIWLPGFFTLGLTYSLTFERLRRAVASERPQREASKPGVGA